MGIFDKSIVKKALLVCYSGAITAEIWLAYILARSFAIYDFGDVLFYVFVFLWIGVGILFALMGIWNILRKWRR